MTNNECIQVIVGSEDLAANHDVMQIVEVPSFEIYFFSSQR